ncbi:hypothetical protein F4679DRAFT_415148 [Xylaria curta]|nr:hypothetical protein F4679DRAFT_415148 [Xylaria curta]
MLTNDPYEIRDQEGKFVPDLSATRHPLEENVGFVLDVMEHLARFFLVLELSDKPLLESMHSSREHFGAVLVDSHHKNFHPFGPYFNSPAEVKDGDSVELVVQNYGITTLYIHVLAMGALWDIEKLLYANHEIIAPVHFFSGRSQDWVARRESNKGGGEWRLKIRMSVPKKL